MKLKNQKAKEKVEKLLFSERNSFLQILFSHSMFYQLVLNVLHNQWQKISIETVLQQIVKISDQSATY